MVVSAHMQAQDRLATVSSNDSTPDTLKNKITSTGGTLTITEVNDGGNEKLNFETAAGVGEMFLNSAFTTANGTTYLDTRDWRGRVVEYMTHCQDPTRVPAEDWDWSYVHADVRTFRLGTNYDFQGGIHPVGDYQFEGIFGFGSITVQIFCEDATGKIKVTVAGVNAPTPAFPCKLRLRASAVF